MAKARDPLAGAAGDSLAGGWDSPATAFQILDGDARTGDWPALLRALYERRHREEVAAPGSHPAGLSALARLRSGADRVGLVVAGAERERRVQPTPDCDALAAQLVRDYLRRQAPGLEVLRCQTETALAWDAGALVVVGGPGSHAPGEAINAALARRAMGVRGFFFSPAGEARDRAGYTVRCWRLRAHDLPDEPGIPDPEDPYARLPDGRKEDVGILYVGANPLASRHWLIWVAGLGSVGTVGVALALQDPRVAVLVARGLTEPQAYCCALLRYRFADEQRPLEGNLASLALTRGVLRQT